MIDLREGLSKLRQDFVNSMILVRLFTGTNPAAIDAAIYFNLLTIPTGLIRHVSVPSLSISILCWQI